MNQVLGRMGQSLPAQAEPEVVMVAKGLKIVLCAAVMSCVLALFSAETAKAQYVYAGAGYAPAYYGGYYGPTYVVRTVPYVPAPCYVPAPYYAPVVPCPVPRPVYYSSYPTYGYGFGLSLNFRHVDRDGHRGHDGYRGGGGHRGGGGGGHGGGGRGGHR
jgi:hypothetical protein